MQENRSFILFYTYHDPVITRSHRNHSRNRCHSAAHGVRTLKREIQRHVQDPLAEQMLAGCATDGVPVAVSMRDGVRTINGWPVKAVA